MRFSKTMEKSALFQKLTIHQQAKTFAPYANVSTV